MPYNHSSVPVKRRATPRSLTENVVVGMAADLYRLSGRMPNRKRWCCEKRHAATSVLDLLVEVAISERLAGTYPANRIDLER